MIKNTQEQPANQTPQPQRKPNDVGSISVEGHIRIFDPKSKEVFVEQRA